MNPKRKLLLFFLSFGGLFSRFSRFYSCLGSKSSRNSVSQSSHTQSTENVFKRRKRIVNSEKDG